MNGSGAFFLSILNFTGNHDHIHISIREPEIKNEYYIDELVFDDDPLLTTAKRAALENRGGTLFVLV